MNTSIERPELNFSILRATGMGTRPVVRYLQEIFGRENYELFRRAGKHEEYIPEEAKQAVDRRVNEQIGRRFGIEWGGGLWIAAMLRANETVNYARGALFPNQDRIASLTANVFFSTNRPSAVLERLTKPARLIGEQLRAEQLRQVAFAVPCAEEIIADKNDTRERLTAMTDSLEGDFFIGRSGDPKTISIFSYHTPGTNELVGLSGEYPDRNFAEGLWVKKLPFPVRKIGIRNTAEEIVEVVPALYDQREKGYGERVIKGLYKSTKSSALNGGRIEVVCHIEDAVGFRLVIMMGGHPLRDRVAGYLWSKLEALFGAENVIEDDSVDPDNGHPNRFPCRRRKIYEPGSNRPIFEVIVQSLEDYISTEYEIGRFNKALGRYDGRAHPLYELLKVSTVAPDLWPFPIFGIDIKDATRTASLEHAARLARVYREYPSPYGELEL